jgi:hypothetical protein
LPPRKNQGPGFTVGLAGLAPFSPGEGNARQVKHDQNIRRPQFIGKAEAKNVEVHQGAARFHRKQGGLGVLKLLGQIGSGQIGAIAQLPGLGIQNAIENDVP